MLRIWNENERMDSLLRIFFLTEKSSHSQTKGGNRISHSSWLSFHQTINSLTRNYVGDSVEDICSKVGLKKSNAKNFYNMLAVRMLDLEADYAAVFIRSDIRVKAIRLEKDGSLREHFRLFDADFEEHDRAKTFEDSDFYRFLSETLMLILVFKSNGFEYLFQGAFLWRIPDADLSVVKREFLEAQKIIRQGIQFEVCGTQVLNNLPKPERHGVSHLRTHASQSYYMFDDNRGNVGKGSISNTVPVPHTGHRCTRHSYWLNKWYMLKQVENYLTD